MAHWYAPTMAPRIHFGAVSDWYRGTKRKRVSETETLKTSCGGELELTNRGNLTDTKTGEESTSQEHGDRSSSSLESDAEIEDPSGDHETGTTTDVVTHEGGGEGAEECAG